MVPDPGDAKNIVVDRDQLYCSLNPSTTETRVLNAPPTAGLRAHIGCLASQTVVVTVKNSSNGTTGTITFTTVGQWIGLVSCELTTGVYSWQAVDVYGCTTTLQTANNWSAQVAAGTMTTLVVSTSIVCPAVSGTNVTLASNITALTGVFKSIDCSTGLTCPAATLAAIANTNLTVLTAASIASILGTNISCASATISSNLSVPNITAGTALVAKAATVTALNVGTGGMIATAACPTLGLPFASSGGSTASAGMQLPSAPIVLLNVSSAGAYYKMPTGSVGLACNVVNVGSASGIVVNAVTSNSIGGAVSLGIGVANASTAALDLVYDGTNWFKASY